MLCTDCGKQHDTTNPNCGVKSIMATDYELFQKRHPWLLRWEGLKLALSEWWCERHDFNTYLFSYTFEKMKWEFEIRARSQQEAIARLRAIRLTAHYDGELKATLKVTP